MIPLSTNNANFFNRNVVLSFLSANISFDISLVEPLDDNERAMLDEAVEAEATDSDNSTMSQQSTELEEQQTNQSTGAAQPGAIQNDNNQENNQVIVLPLVKLLLYKMYVKVNVSLFFLCLCLCEGYKHVFFLWWCHTGSRRIGMLVFLPLPLLCLHF